MNSPRSAAEIAEAVIVENPRWRVVQKPHDMVTHVFEAQRFLPDPMLGAPRWVKVEAGHMVMHMLAEALIAEREAVRALRSTASAKEGE